VFGLKGVGHDIILASDKAPSDSYSWGGDPRMLKLTIRSIPFWIEIDPAQY